MNTIVEFVKNYFIFLLVLYLFSYLAPQESYRKYFRFFVSALMIAVLMKPMLGFLGTDAREQMRGQLDAVIEQMQQQTYEGKGEDIFAWFWQHEGLDDKAFQDEE